MPSLRAPPGQKLDKDTDGALRLLVINEHPGAGSPDCCMPQDAGFPPRAEGDQRRVTVQTT
jgi:hypothetical protein